MQRIALGLLLLLVTACTDNGVPSLRSGAPGVEVAQAALRGGSPQIALQVVDSILARDPSNQAALVIQGEALTALGQFDAASTSFEKVLQQDNGSVAAHIGLGRIRLSSDPSGAEALFLQALQSDPRNGVALNDLGIARDLQGRHADAQTAYRQALGSNPDMQAARVNLALSLAMAGQGGEAVQLLRPLANGPAASRQMRHDLAAVLVMNGDRSEAANILSKDLSPAEVQQALDGYAAARSSGGGTLLTPAEPPPAPPPAAAAPAPAAPAVSSQPPRSAIPASVPVASAPDAKAPVADAELVSPPAVPVLPPIAKVSASPADVVPESHVAAVPSERVGTIQVQLSASDSEDAARQQWQRLQGQLPDLFGNREPAVTRFERDGHVFWRLRTGGFADAGEAGAFCERIYAAGLKCIVVR